MKKILYFILLAAELFVGTLFMIPLWEMSMYIPIVLASVASAALLTCHIVLFAKATDTARKKQFCSELL